MKRKWSKVSRGDVIDLRGVAWTVEKIKPKGEKAKVAIRSGSRTADAKVRLADKVRIVERRATSAPQKPAKAKPPQRMPPTRPKPAHGDPWETQQDRVERKLDQILGARLVGESTDGGSSYYVPPVDVQTIRAHMMVFHGDPARDATEVQLLERHEAEHKASASGAALAVAHWHTEKRPTTGKKSGR